MGILVSYSLNLNNTSFCTLSKKKKIVFLRGWQNQMEKWHNKTNSNTRTMQFRYIHTSMHTHTHTYTYTSIDWSLIVFY